MNGIFCLRGTAFGISINFVNIRGLDLPQNIDKGICSGTLPNKMWKILEATVKRDGKVWILQAYFAHVIILLEQIFWQVQGIRFAATNFYQWLTDPVLILAFLEWGALNYSFSQLSNTALPNILPTCFTLVFSENGSSRPKAHWRIFEDFWLLFTNMF